MKIAHLWEAIPISTAKPYVKAWDPNFHKQVFERQPHKDKHAYRVYVPFEQHTQDKITIPENLLSYLQSAIPNKPFTTDPENYFQGLAFEVSNPMRKLGIGKMLARSEASEKDAVRKTELQALKKAFDADPQRSATRKSDLMIVFSRHPYDVASMSTHRGWRSCMDLVDGFNKHYVIRDVKQGSIIAYLIRADDLNINRPIARILIKPYQEKGNPTNLVMMGDAVYGTAPVHFTQAVTDWLDKNYNHGKHGLFCINPQLYRDVLPKQMALFSDEQLKNMHSSTLVTNATVDMLPRISELRSDADQVLWRIGTTEYARIPAMRTAFAFVKQVPMDKFKKLLDKYPSAFRYFPHPTPAMVSYAVEKSPDNLIYLPHRTAVQNKQVIKVLLAKPHLISRVVNPTQDQLLAALKKDPSETAWALEHVPHLVSEDQVRKYVSYSIKRGGIEPHTLEIMHSKFPQLFKQDDWIVQIAQSSTVDLFDQIPLTPAHMLLALKNVGTQYHHAILSASARRKIIHALQTQPHVRDDQKLMRVLTHKFPALVGHVPHVHTSDAQEAIRRDHTSIVHWPNPTPDQIEYAITWSSDPEVARHFPMDAYPQVWENVLKIEPDYVLEADPHSVPRHIWLQVIQNPKLSNHVREVLLNMPELPMGYKVRIIKQRPRLISEVNKPALALQMAAVTSDVYAYDLIRPKLRHPAVKAYMATYRKEMRKPE